MSMIEQTFDLFCFR